LRGLVGAVEEEEEEEDIDSTTTNKRLSDMRVVENSEESKELLSVSGKRAQDSPSSSIMTRVDSSIRRRMRRTSGAYDTVLVILQDLSALEMEEAFDHVDIVIKKGDTASVTIDGELIP